MPGSNTPLIEWEGIALTELSASWANDDAITVNSRWWVNVPREATPQFTVLCDGQAIGQATGAVWGGIHPFAVWQAGEGQSDVRQISVTDRCLTGQLALSVTLGESARNYSLDIN
jgi:hypothetical protein